MNKISVVQPALLSKINEFQVLRTLQARGPLSRAEVARHSGISAPTASKAIESLLRVGFLEEGDADALTRGRPAKKLRLARETAQVLGLVIDAERCELVSAGLDGGVHLERVFQFPTPANYDDLLAIAESHARRLLEQKGVTTLAMAISMPGLIDYRRDLGILSPNVPVTNRHSPSRDLSARLGIECIMVQESHALCLAERYFGEARTLDDFAMMDIGSGVGLGVMSGGRLLTGYAGLAGELGHITVELDGKPCGCGNRGCLETVASEAAFAGMVSQRLGRKVEMDEVLTLMQNGTVSLDAELEKTCRYLAVGVAAVLNLFNPSTLFLYNRLFTADESLFGRLLEETQRRALPPSFADCRIVRAQSSKRLGAVAAVIEHLTTSVVPSLVTDTPVHALSAGKPPKRVAPHVA